jgi:hypothetical protein
MPLIEAAGTSVERIRPDSVKNSTPPRANLAKRVGVRTQLAIGEDLQVEAAISLLFDRGRHFARASVHRVRFWKIVCVFVDPLRLLSASDARGGGWSQKRQARAGKQPAPSHCRF